MAGRGKDMSQGIAQTLFPFGATSVWSDPMMILIFFAAVLLLGFTPAPQAGLLLLSRR